MHVQFLEFDEILYPFVLVKDFRVLCDKNNNNKDVC